MITDSIYQLPDQMFLINNQLSNWLWIMEKKETTHTHTRFSGALKHTSSSCWCLVIIVDNANTFLESRLSIYWRGGNKKFTIFWYMLVCSMYIIKLLKVLTEAGSIVVVGRKFFEEPNPDSRVDHSIWSANLSVSEGSSWSLFLLANKGFVTWYFGSRS